MCEILFRAKRLGGVDAGAWVEGSLIFYPRVNRAFFSTGDFNERQFYEVQKDTVGQYTGLKDKNGKRIFEGDVVKMFHKDDFCEIGPVMWSDIGARYKFAPPVGAAYNIDCTCVMEIVGNIHDNPELLKGEGK